MAKSNKGRARSLTIAAALIVAAQIGSSPRMAIATEESGGGPTAGPKPTQVLYDEIAAADQIFFAAVFDTCDTVKRATLVTDDSTG